MAIEIKELIVKAVVPSNSVASNSDNSTDNDTENQQDENGAEPTFSYNESASKTELIKACVKEVLKILRKSKER